EVVGGVAEDAQLRLAAARVKDPVESQENRREFSWHECIAIVTKDHLNGIPIGLASQLIDHPARGVDTSRANSSPMKSQSKTPRTNAKIQNCTLWTREGEFNEQIDHRLGLWPGVRIQGVIVTT